METARQPWYLRRHRWIVLISRVFLAIVLALFLYLCIIVADDPAKRSAKARRIAGYQAPAEYVLNSAVYSYVSRFAVFSDLDSDQRLVLIHKRRGPERHPEGFRALFWPVGRRIEKYPKHGVFNAWVTTATDSLSHHGLDIFVATGDFTRNGVAMSGSIALAVCPGNGTSIFVVSDAVSVTYDESEFREFLLSLECPSDRKP